MSLDTRLEAGPLTRPRIDSAQGRAPLRSCGTFLRGQRFALTTLCLRAHLAVLLFVGCSVAYGASPYQTARIVEQSASSIVVEFVFTDSVRTTAQDIKADGIEIRLRGSTLSAQFDQKDENFAGDLGPIERVSVEGSGAGGYKLSVSLNAPMSIEVLPPPDNRRIAIRLTKAAPRESEVAQAPLPVAEETMGAPDIASKVQIPMEQNASRATDVVASPGANATPNASAATGTGSVPGDFRKALDEGRQAAMSQDYPRAIAFFTKASQSPDVATRQEALEMLATARERNHQDAQAKVIYEQFLAQYPDSEAAPRIRQRLSGLLTRNLPVKKKLIKPESDGGMWTAVGNVSQFYQRNEIEVNGENPVTGVDGLFTNADIIVDRRSSNLDLGMRVSTNGLYDFGSDGNSTYQMSTAYFEAQQIDWGVDVRVGRQSQQSNGVLGRYDGAQIRYKVASWLEVGAIGGYAVDYSNNAFSADRPLYGVNAEISLADGRWEFAPFYIEQQANGLLDRRAIGMETRYFRDNMSAFSLLDYDTYHKALNTSYVMLNVRFENGLTSYATFDHRRSPYITTENALIGQGVNNLGDLENTYSDQQIEQLADDRTSTLTLATVGVDKEISPRLQIGSDVSYSDYAETQASGNVAAVPSQQDYYYTLRFRSDEIFGSQTYSALYLRYADGNDSRMSSIYWNNRFTFFSEWQFYPRIRVDYRDFTNTGDSQWTVAPSMRLDYRPNRNMYLEFEAGYDKMRRDSNIELQQMDVIGYYFRLGYRTLF